MIKPQRTRQLTPPDGRMATRQDVVTSRPGSGSMGRDAPRPTGGSALPGRRERNKQAKRNRIKAAARELFSAKGFTATTTQAIAEKADIGTGTLFLYVQSKEELLVLVFRDEMGRASERAFASLPRGASLLDQLLHVYSALIAFHERDQELTRVFVKELMFVSEGDRQAVVDFIDGLLSRWAALIDGAKDRDEIEADVPALLLAENCFATYLLLLQRWLGLPGPLAAPEHLSRLRQAFALQLRGLGPATNAPPTVRQHRGRRSAHGRCNTHHRGR